MAHASEYEDIFNSHLIMHIIKDTTCKTGENYLEK